jgi:hypothetical protein
MTLRWPKDGTTTSRPHGTHDALTARMTWSTTRKSEPAIKRLRPEENSLDYLDDRVCSHYQ